MKKIAVVMAMAALLVALVAGLAVAKEVACKTIPCNGTSSPDQIAERNGSKTDIIRGKAGDDEIDATGFGEDHDDVLGQEGNDTIDVADEDFRDNANCGSGAEDTGIIDVLLVQETIEDMDGTRGCEVVEFNFVGGPPPKGLSSEEIRAASETKGAANLRSR